MPLEVGVLRELFRSYQSWLALFETEGIDTIPGPNGEVYSLWDVQYLLGIALSRLPPRQAEAIRLCLVEGSREQDAAVKMGVSVTNPVASYATAGLRNLIKMIEEGDVERFGQEAM